MPIHYVGVCGVENNGFVSQGRSRLCVRSAVDAAKYFSSVLCKMTKILRRKAAGKG